MYSIIPEEARARKNVKLVVKDATDYKREVENPFSGLWRLPDELKAGNVVRGLVDGREYKIVAIIQT